MTNGSNDRKGGPGGGLPDRPDQVRLAGEEKKKIDKKRLFFIFLGLGLFLLMVLIPELPSATDPSGKVFELAPEGKAALGLFLLAAIWWVFEVVPIGVTSIMIAVVQAMFLTLLIDYGEKPAARTARDAFTDFMDSSVWFIFGSIVIGLVFTKTGLTKRMAYKMLSVVGEKTSMIYLGCFVMTAALTHIMAHTAVAATVFPLLMAIYSLYTDEEEPTKFGKGLFMGMAFVAGAGSIITLLGAARGAVAIGFYNEIVLGKEMLFQGVAHIPKEISFFDITYYMFLPGWLMVFVLWGYFMVVYKPESARIPGLRERARNLYSKLGPWTKIEILTLAIVLATVVVMSLRSFVPELKPINKSAIILVSTLLFFLFNILDLDDLEEIPWNIILLFGGAMSIGFCLWQTGAAEWLAVTFIVLFEQAHWFIFVMAITFFVLIMTNLIMNVAAIAISLPVAMVLAPYLGVTPEIIMYAALVAAGMPFLFLVGAAPNAIAYGSGQFTSGEFFKMGIPASLILMVVIGIFVSVVWPIMGMPILIK